MVVLDDGDPSEPYIRRVTAVYTHVVSTVAAAITARALRLDSCVIRRTEGAMLTTGLAITGRIRRARDYLIKTACFLSGRLAPAWHVRQMLVAAYGRLCISEMGTMMRLQPFWVLALLPLVRTAGDESKRVPSFSGERVDFTAWFMLFSAYVAYDSPRVCYRIERYAVLSRSIYLQLCDTTQPVCACASLSSPTTTPVEPYHLPLDSAECFASS